MSRIKPILSALAFAVALTGLTACSGSGEWIGPNEPHFVQPQPDPPDQQPPNPCITSRQIAPTPDATECVGTVN
jgi:hypothetical protein